MNRRAFLRAGGAAGVAVALPQTTAVAAAADPEAFEPLGSVEITGAAEAVVGDDGETAYLATNVGFATVDISDPSAPELLEHRYPLSVDDVPFSDIYDVKVDGDRLAVVGPANPTSAEVFHGFAIYDVSDPADPVLVGEPYETGFSIHNCAFEDGILYVVNYEFDGDSLVVYDVGDGVSEIGRWSLLEHDPDWEAVDPLARTPHDVTVRDGVAYLAHWDAGTYLLDVSDPAEPTYVSHVRSADLEETRDLGGRAGAYGLPGNDHYAAVDDTGDLLAVGREAWSIDGESWAPDDPEPDGPGGIDLYDISDPANPAELASIEAPETDDASYDGTWTTSHNFELRDGRLYSSWYQGGLAVHDVTEPAEPVELARWRETDAAAFWTARVAVPGETLVASSTGQTARLETDGGLYTFPIGFADADREADGDDDAGLRDSIPGFTGAAGLAGGAVTLEWLRRRARDK